MTLYGRPIPGLEVVASIGQRVDRVAEVLPQGGDKSLFTITGGRILLPLILGEVTVLIGGANASLLKSNPTATGATQDMCAALDIATDAVGTYYTISGVVGDALRDDLLIGLGMGFQGMILPPGAIELECAGSVSGEIKWSAWWIPLDQDANLAVT